MVTKYQPLVDYIAAQTGPTVTLTFPAIEAILGFPMPETMRIETVQWRSYSYVLAWHLRAAGWDARLDRRNRCVLFTRAEG